MAKVTSADLNIAKKMRSMQRNMFNFLQSKEIKCKLIDLDANLKKDDGSEHIENYVIQGKKFDRFNNEFTFQVVVDKNRLKEVKAQQQVTVVLQHAEHKAVKMDVNTNGELYVVVENYIYESKESKMHIYESKKEEAAAKANK